MKSRLRHHVPHSLVSEEEELDQDALDALNDVCTKALKVMLDNNEAGAMELHDELVAMQEFVLMMDDTENARFIKVVMGLLYHTVLEDVESLTGAHLKAFNRVVNMVTGSDWRLAELGAPETPQEPQFDNWEDMVAKKQRQDFEREFGKLPGAGPSTNDDRDVQRVVGPKGQDPDDYYALLEVPTTATKAELKKAYRALALQWHPDVTSDPGASQKFQMITKAYDVLSDPEARELFDRFGAQGMQGRTVGNGNSREVWDEFERVDKKSRRRSARDSSANNVGGLDDDSDREPDVGDLVEYPLPQVVKDEMMDGRTHGVGVLVSRNKDRGDVKTLPEELLGRCEIDPLAEDPYGSNRWAPDELGNVAFADLCDLKIVPIKSFDRRFDVWELTAPDALSVGCGSPDYGEVDYGITGKGY